MRSELVSKLSLPTSWLLLGVDICLKNGYFDCRIHLATQSATGEWYGLAAHPTTTAHCSTQSWNFKILTKC